MAFGEVRLSRQSTYRLRRIDGTEIGDAITDLRKRVRALTYLVLKLLHFLGRIFFLFSSFVIYNPNLLIYNLNKIKTLAIVFLGRYIVIYIVVYQQTITSVGNFHLRRKYNTIVTTL